MSHIQAMCDKLGFVLHEGGKTKSYYQRDVQDMDYTIEFKSQPNISSTYNAGLKKNAEGHYDLFMDNSISGQIITDTTTLTDRNVVKTAGKTTGIRKAMQLEYSKSLVQSICKKRGFRYQELRSKTAKGYTKLKLTT